MVAPAYTLEVYVPMINVWVGSITASVSSTAVPSTTGLMTTPTLTNNTVCLCRRCYQADTNWHYSRDKSNDYFNITYCLTGGWKRKLVIFHLKMYLSGRKSAAKFLCVKTVSGKVVRYSLAYLSVHKWLVGDVPVYLTFSKKWPTPLWNGAFQSIFARSSTSITASEKSSIITNRKCSTCFPMSLIWTSYPTSKPPPKGV